MEDATQPIIPSEVATPSQTEPLKQKGYFLPILIAVIVIIIVVAGGYLLYQKQNKIIAPSQQTAQPTTIDNSLSGISLKDKRLVAYSEEEIFEYQPGKNGVRGRNIIIYDITQNTKKTILTDTTKNFSYYPQSWSPDGTKLLITSGVINKSVNPNSVFIEKTALLNLTTGNTEDLPDEAVKPDIAWYSNTELIFFPPKDTYTSIGKFDINSKQISELGKIPKVDNLNVSSDLRDFSLSPDNSKILFNSFGMGVPANIYVYDLKSSQVKKLTNGGGDSSPKWIDNNSLIFTRRDRAGDSIWMIDVNSNKETQLVSDKEGIDSTNSFRYTYATDKKQLIYPSKFSKQGQDIMSLDFTSKSPKLLFNIPYADFTSAQVTKDDSYLIFSSLATGTIGSKTLFLYDISQGKLTKICDPGVDFNCQSFILH